MNGTVNIERGQNSPPEAIRVCVRSAEKALISPIMVLPLSAGTVCALHSNVLIYSLLKLNAAVNAASDSITLCPRSNADEACVPLIKFRHATETAKMRHGERRRRQPPWRAQIPDLIRKTEELILRRENSPYFRCLRFSERMLTFGSLCHEVPCVPWWTMPSGLVYSTPLRPLRGLRQLMFNWHRLEP